jgi:hypothetical protein
METATVVNPSTITGAGSLTVNVDAASANFFPQPGFTGALTLILNASAARVGYVATPTSSWAGSPPANVAAALDRCAALLKTLNGGVGP